MNEIKRKAFLGSMAPLLEELRNSWFPPDEKTLDGNYYACTHCDLNCGQHDKHDDTCLYQMAKDTLEKWEEIDRDTKWDLDWDEKPRDPKDIEELKVHFKYYAVFDHFIKNVSAFVPVDYTDPANSNTACPCSMHTKHIDRHTKECIDVRVARILRELLKPTGPGIKKT